MRGLVFTVVILCSLIKRSDALPEIGAIDWGKDNIRCKFMDKDTSTIHRITLDYKINNKIVSIYDNKLWTISLEKIEDTEICGVTNFSALVVTPYGPKCIDNRTIPYGTEINYSGCMMASNVIPTYIPEWLSIEKEIDECRQNESGISQMYFYLSGPENLRTLLIIQQLSDISVDTIVVCSTLQFRKNFVTPIVVIVQTKYYDDSISKRSWVVKNLWWIILLSFALMCTIISIVVGEPAKIKASIREKTYLLIPIDP